MTHNPLNSTPFVRQYIGIVKALRKALADYTANVGSGSGGDPTVDKKLLIQRVIELIEKTNHYLADKGFSLEKLVYATGFEKEKLVQIGADSVCDSLEERKEFQTYAAELSRIMKYLHSLRENEWRRRWDSNPRYVAVQLISSFIGQWLFSDF